MSRDQSSRLIRYIAERSIMDEKTQRWLYLREIGDNSGAWELARRYPHVERAGEPDDNFDWSSTVE